MKKVIIATIYFNLVIGAIACHAQQNNLIPGKLNSEELNRIGRVEAFTISSAIMKETRRILIALPASYSKSSPGRRYPVTVVTDGDFFLAPVLTASNELTSNGQIPESVIVAIENTGGKDELSSNTKRVYDLTPPGLSISGSSLNEGGDLFLDFIEKEVLPAVNLKFRTTRPLTFIGFSSGAVLATYVAATRSTYSTVISLDAPVNMGDNWLAKKLIARISSSLPPIRYASLEAIYGWPENAWQSLTNTAPGSWKLYREKMQMEGHETISLIGAYIGLRQLFSDYSRLSSQKLPATNVISYYDNIGRSLGENIIPPKRVLQNLVQNLVSEGRAKEAREAYQLLSFGYGGLPDSMKILKNIAEVEKQPAMTETVASILATPFPGPEEMKNYVGEWAGDIWMGADQPRTGNTLLRIKIEGGKVVGANVRRAPSGEETVLTWGYLKITPGGITWGRLNDKEPKAVMVFEGKLNGDILSGEAQFRGLKLDDAPPPLKFSFRKIAGPTGKVSDDQIISKTEEYVQAANKVGKFSGAILIARDGKILLSKGYGMSNYEEAVAVTKETKFRIASITKQFTAMAILQLQEQGKLNVHETVCKYLTGCPSEWKQITIHQLLNHTSGIPDITKIPGFSDTNKMLVTPASLVARFRDQTLDFTPGEQFRYSNSGYILLGFLIEKISGMTYEQFLQKNIFDPLKMTNSGYDHTETKLTQRAIGYGLEKDKFIKAGYVNMSVPYAAGGLYSTIEDLYKWDQALYTEKLISKKSLDAMFTPGKNNYGYGFIINQEFDKKFISHSGVIDGFTSFIGRYPGDKLTVIVLNNNIDSKPPVVSMGRDLAAIAFDEKYAVFTTHAVVPVDPKVYNNYVGEYEREPGKNLVITKEEDKLYLSFTGRPKVELFPESPNRFFIKQVDVQISFVNEGGKVTHLILHQLGENIKANKVK